MKAIRGILLAAGLCHSSLGYAQSCHALTGNWKLDPGASRLGAGLSFNPYLAVRMIDLQLRQGPAGIYQQWHFQGAHVDEIVTYTVRPDNVAAPTNARSVLSAIPLEIRAEWQNCTLIEHARTNLFNQTIWTTNTYVIDPAGTRLTIGQVSLSDVGNADRALVFTLVSKSGRGAQ